MIVMPEPSGFPPRYRDLHDEAKFLKVYETIVTHPKIARAAHLLNIHEDRLIGALVRLWMFAMREKSNDGVLRNLGPDDIVVALRMMDVDETAAVIEVLVNETHLLDLVDGEFRVHNWTAGKRTGAKFRETSEIASHGAHVRWEDFSPSSCRYCAEHQEHRDSGEIVEKGCGWCDKDRKAMNTEDALEEASQSRDSQESGSQKGQDSMPRAWMPDRASQVGIPDSDSDSDLDPSSRVSDRKAKASRNQIGERDDEADPERQYPDEYYEEF